MLEVKPGSDTPITIKVLRKDNVKFGVTITAVRLANNTITTKGVFVPPEKDEAEIVLTVAKDAKPLRQDMIVSGLMRANNQSIVRFARAIPVTVVAERSGEVFEVEAAGIDRHAERGVDVHREQRLHVFHRGDAAGGGDFERGGGAQAAEPVEVGALHHAFLIDIGAEEAGAVGFQRRAALLRR